MSAWRTTFASLSLLVLIGACTKTRAGASAGQGASGGQGGSVAAQSGTGAVGGADDGAGGAAAGNGGGAARDASQALLDAGALDGAIDGAIDAASDAPLDGPIDTGLDHACLDGITDYTSAGPFAFETATVESVRMWLPSVPSGCHVPVVSFANGTAAQCRSYAASFEHLASHGFLVACYETGQTGDGTHCETAIAVAFEAYPQLADRRIGIGGHVQGGGSAAVCVQRAQERWGASVRIAGFGAQPEHGWGGMGPDYPERYAQIRSPMFVFHGTEAGEGAANWVGDGFALLDPSTEAYWYAAVGAPYLPVPFAWINESTVAWLRWQLLDDAVACAHFTDTMPASSMWDLEAAHNPRECAP